MSIRCLAGVLLFACSPLLCANNTESSSPAAAPTQGLDPVLVTATRTSRSRSASLAPNTVITREEIERTQAQSVRELLQRSPGISVANQGGSGKITELRLRGTESDHVLVLVNGVRYNSATSGLAAVQDIPVGQIERIEIVRGPRSALYGSDAIGGVIQIFTRDGGEDAKPYFNVGTGTYDTYEGQVGVAGGNDRANYSVSLGGKKTDGFDSCTGRPFGAPGGGAGCFANEPDDDAYSRTSGSMRAGYRFANGVRLNAHALRVEGDNEFDGTAASGNEAETLRQVYGISVGGRPDDAWNMELSLNRSRDESDNFFNGRFINSIDSIRDTVKLQNDIALSPDNLLTIGADYRRSQVESTTQYNQTQRDNTGVFMQYLGMWGDHELQLAARGDDNEQFGEHATGSVTYGWDFTDVHTVTVSYGTAFKAPTFDELYFPGLSNPDLEPEESRSLELGLTSNRAWGRWALRAYETRIDELIALDSMFTPQNISETRLRGVEAEIGASFGAWLLNANTTWLDAKNRSDGANAGNELPRRPEYSAQVDLDRRFGRFSAGISVFAASSTFDNVSNTRTLDGYEVVDLRGQMHVNTDWSVEARIGNLLDENYETAALYNQPGRNLFVTLRYQPE